MKSIFSILIFLSLFIAPSFAEAGRGCCSWHGGQSYCGSSGYWICNDGTRSPTCTCSYSPPKQPAPVKAVAPSKTANQIVQENIESVRADYLKNPHGFREKLLSDLELKLKYDREFLASRIYALLRDVK